MKATMPLSFALGWIIACGGPLTYQLTGTPKAIGADGNLQATIYKDEHETKLVLDVKNLAPPPRIAPDAKTFVVWGRRDSTGTWQRVGNVVYNEQGRAGLFKGSFPEVDFDLEVSVEREDTVVSPSPDIVFAQHVGPT